MKRFFDTIRRAQVTRPTPISPPSSSIEGSKVLLVVPFAGWEDGVVLAPILQATLDAGAKPPLGVVTRPEMARVLKLFDLPLKNHPLPDILTLPEDAPEWHSPETQAAEEQFAQGLQKRRYDIAADIAFMADVDARRWVAQSNAETRLGFVDPGERVALDELTGPTEDPRDDEQRHWSTDHSLPLRPVGVGRPNHTVSLIESEKATDKIKALLGPKPRVVLAPTTIEDAADPERFERIAQWVIHEAGGSALFVGPPSEGKHLRKLAKATNATVYAQKDLAPLLSAIRLADAVVSEANGPAQLSFLLKKPTVAILSDHPPAVWGPAQPDPRFVVLGPLDPETPDVDSEGVRTRAVLHFLDGLLAKYARP